MKTSKTKCVLVLGAAAAVVWGCGSADDGATGKPGAVATVHPTLPSAVGAPHEHPSTSPGPRSAQAMPAIMHVVFVR